MKNNKKLLIFIAVIACAAIIIALFTKTNSPLETESSNNETESNKPPIVEAVIQSEFEADTIEDVSQIDLSSIKYNYWYLYDYSEKCCYIFYFSDNQRVDINYLDISTGSDSKFEYGYSVYYQNGDDIILKYLPECFPVKNFTLTIKDNEIYFDNAKLDKEMTLSKEIIYYHFSRS